MGTTDTRVKVLPSRKLEGVYVCLYPSTLDIAFVENLLTERKIDIDRPLHTTIIYSKQPARVNPRLYADPLKKYVTKIEQVVAWNTDSDNPCVVAELEPTEQLLETHEKWKDLGMQHSYPEWKPHLCLHYGLISDDHLEYLNEQLTGYTLTLDRETIMPINK